MWYNYAQNGESQFNAMSMIDAIQAKRENIYAIAKKHGVGKLWVFGSVARKEERPDSDVDFLAEMPQKMTYFGLCDFTDELKGVVGRSVEIVSHEALEKSPCFAYNVKKDMLPI